MKRDTSREEWKEFVTGDGIKARSSDTLEVMFSGGRSHRLRISEEENGWRLEAMVVRDFHDSGKTVFDPFRWVAVVNRGLRMCALELGEDGHLTGTAWVPMAGLTKAEFQLVVRNLAAECDRLEFSLTGKDQE